MILTISVLLAYPVIILENLAVADYFDRVVQRFCDCQRGWELETPERSARFTDDLRVKVRVEGQVETAKMRREILEALLLVAAQVVPAQPKHFETLEMPDVFEADLEVESAIFDVEPRKPRAGSCDGGQEIGAARRLMQMVEHRSRDRARQQTPVNSTDDDFPRRADDVLDEVRFGFAQVKGAAEIPDGAKRERLPAVCADQPSGPQTSRCRGC